MATQSHCNKCGNELDNEVKGNEKYSSGDSFSESRLQSFNGEGVRLYGITAKCPSARFWNNHSNIVLATDLKEDELREILSNRRLENPQEETERILETGEDIENSEEQEQRLEDGANIEEPDYDSLIENKQEEEGDNRN